MVREERGKLNESVLKANGPPDASALWLLRGEERRSCDQQPGHMTHSYSLLSDGVVSGMSAFSLQ